MLFLLLLACTETPIVKDSNETARPEPTETFPSFYGELPRNILMISVDTYRRDYMARYGGDPTLTPFMDKLASEGVALDNMRGCSNWTYPAGACTLSGRYSLEDGAIPKIANGYRDPMPDRPTLAGHLSSSGFYTIMLTSNGWFSSDYNLDYGYNYSEHPGSDFATTIYNIGRDKLLDVLEKEDPDRWMLHLHFKEPHSPYNPPDSYITELEDLDPIDFDISCGAGHEDAKEHLAVASEEERELLLQHFNIRYQGEMRYMDDLLSEIFVDLELRHLLDDTLVVVWTDHGEAFWEREKLTHAYYLLKEENDIVSFFWAHNIVQDTWDGPTSQVDIAASILDLYGITVPEEDLSGVPVGQADPERPLFGMSVARAGPVQSVMIGTKTLQYVWEQGSIELLDSEGDPGQELNIYDPYVEDSAMMWDLLEPKVHELVPLVPEYTAEEPEQGWSEIIDK